MSIKRALIGFFFTTAAVTTTVVITKKVLVKKYSNVPQFESEKDPETETDISVSEKIKTFAANKVNQILGFVMTHQEQIQAVGSLAMLIGSVVDIIYRIHKFKDIDAINKQLKSIALDGSAYERGRRDQLDKMVGEMFEKSRLKEPFSFDNHITGAHAEFLVKEVVA